MLHTALPGLILERTHGRMQAVVNLVRRATVAAIEDGSWCVTQEHVRSVPAAKLTRDEDTRVARPAPAPEAIHPTVSVGQQVRGGAG